MKTIKKVEVVPEFVGYIPAQGEMKDGIIYISRQFETASHLCLCGCKNLVVTPLSEGWWSLLIEDEKVITIAPSIGNFQIPCQSHYIITRNKANFV